MVNRGMVISMVCYGVLWMVLGILGLMLWIWFLVDLGWRAIVINYGCVVFVVFVLV